MNKLVIRPEWTEEDDGGWMDAFGIGKHIAKHFYDQFSKYGTIVQFEAYINSKKYNLEVYYIATYADPDVPQRLLGRVDNVDYVVEFLTFDIITNIESYESLGPECLHDDFPLYYYTITI